MSWWNALNSAGGNPAKIDPKLLPALPPFEERPLLPASDVKATQLAKDRITIDRMTGDVGQVENAHQESQENKS